MMVDYKYIGTPYNLGECREQTFGSVVSCTACINDFDKKDPPVSLGSAPGEALAMIDIARMGRWVFLHITGVLLPKAYEDKPELGDQNEKGEAGPMIFKEKLPREFIGKSANARSFVIAMCDYSPKDDVLYKKDGVTRAHSGKFTIMQDGSMKITDLNGNPFIPLYGDKHGDRPYTGFKSIDVFYCINNYEDSDNAPDPEVDDVDQNGDMSDWEKMKIPLAYKTFYENHPDEGNYPDEYLTGDADDDPTSKDEDGDDPMQDTEP